MQGDCIAAMYEVVEVTSHVLLYAIVFCNQPLPSIILLSLQSPPPPIPFSVAPVHVQVCLPMSSRSALSGHFVVCISTRPAQVGVTRGWIGEHKHSVGIRLRAVAAPQLNSFHLHEAIHPTSHDLQRFLESVHIRGSWSVACCPDRANAADHAVGAVDTIGYAEGYDDRVVTLEKVDFWTH